MNLYLDELPVFEKIAAEVDLPENAAQWPQEITQELYKQAPYVADFQPDVNMEAVNAEQGYGFGHFEVQNKTEVPDNATPEQEKQIGVSRVRIPIIVKDFKLLPFDVLVTEESKMWPLTEDRLRQALFRPQAFDVTSQTPGDQSMVGQLYPPYRQNYGLGGEGGGMGEKMGSALEQYLKKEAEAKNTQDIAARIASALDIPAKKANVNAYPLDTLGVDREELKKTAYTAPELIAFLNALGSPVEGGIKGRREARELGASTLEGAVRGSLGSLAGASLGALGGGVVGHGVGLLAEHAPGLTHHAGAFEPVGMVLGGNYFKGKGYDLAMSPVRERAREKASRDGEKTGAVTHPVSDAALGLKVKDVVPKVKVRENKSDTEKTSSLLSAIQHTVYAGDYDHVSGQIEKHATAYLSHKHYTKDALRKLASISPVTLEDRFNEYAPALVPTAMQLERSRDGYVVKTASNVAWRPVHQDIGRGDAVRMFGEKIVLAADMSGAVTIEEGPGVQEAVDAQDADAPSVDVPDVSALGGVRAAGQYKVQTTDGRDLVGFVIPGLVDIDGSHVSVSLFTNGTEFALQQDIAGEQAEAGVFLPEGNPRGKGFFYRQTGEDVEATVPLQILSSAGGEGFIAQTFDGRDVRVVIQPNVRRVVGMEGTMILPEGFRWCPTGDAEVQLVGEQENFSKQSSAARKFASVTVRAGSEDSFSFDGIPVHKLASAERSFLSYNDALFLLAGLGTDTKYGATKLAESLAFSTPVEVRVGRHITPMEEAVQDSHKTASALLAKIPNLKVDLVKEAAFVPDPVAVDTILSLGFINPENLRTFVGYLPKIESVVSKLCELLVASRLGVKDLPVGALEKTVKMLEDVVQGLKTMAFVYMGGAA